MVGKGLQGSPARNAFQTKGRAVFLYGFAKNERENIEDDELTTLKEIAAAWMAADATKIGRALKAPDGTGARSPRRHPSQGD